MGFLDKAKETASHLAGQAKDKIGEVKERRKADDLLDDLGKILFRQRTERGEPGDDAEIDRIVADLRALEADGAEIVPPPPAAAEESSPPPPPPPPPPAPPTPSAPNAADSGAVVAPDPPAAV